jgi:hypothetical protein
VVRFPVGTNGFSLLQNVQSPSGAHPVSNSMAAEVLSLGVKRSGRESNPSPPSSAVVKSDRSYTSAPPIRLRDLDRVMINYARQRHAVFFRQI